jgi:hypothetical protein
MTSINLYEAYAAVYNEDFKTDLLEIGEDLSFVDDLSDNELVRIMEEIISEEEVTLQECLDVFDAEILSEESEMERMNRLQNKATRERKSAAATAKREKSAERERVGRKHAVKRLQVAATRAGRNIADRAKTLGAGAASAAAGGAAEAGRAASAAKEKVKGKLASAKEKMKGMVKSGRKAVAGGLRSLASKVEPKEKTGKEVKTAAKTAIRNTRHSGGGVGRKEKASSGGIKSKTAPGSGSGPSSSGRALPPVGAGTRTPSGNLRKDSQRVLAMSRAAAQGRKALNREDYEMLASALLEDLINEGYAETFEEAFTILESFSDYEVGEMVESYLMEDVETVDVYDIVLEHLVIEGYADTLEQAEVIMVNMSEEWRDEIIEEGYKKLPVGKMMGKVQRLAFKRGAATDDNTPENTKSHTRTATMSVTADMHDPEKVKAREYKNRVRGAAKKVYG